VKIYTFEDIQALNPCHEYRDDDWTKLRRLVGSGVTKEQIATADVQWQDRVWVLVRLMPTASVPLYAADIAETVLHLVREQDRAVCQEAIDAARSGDRDRARRAAYAAYAADAAYAAYAAAYAADAAYAAYAAYAAADAADAAYAAYAAYAAADGADAAYAAYAAYAAADGARRGKRAESGERSVQLALRYVP
jgi:hypothetical protein